MWWVACIIEFLREAGFYYLIWMARYPTQLFIKSVTNWRHSQVELIPTTEHHHYNSFIERKQRWENPTCQGRLICPEGRVSSLNKCNPIQSNTAKLNMKGFCTHNGNATYRRSFVHHHYCAILISVSAEKDFLLARQCTRTIIAISICKACIFHILFMLLWIYVFFWKHSIFSAMKANLCFKTRDAIL